MPSKSIILSALFIAGAVAGSLKDVKHVVMMMQENRAFDHYYGTMAGVRGFGDPNVQINPDGRTTYQQIVTPEISNLTTSLTPWHLEWLGGNWTWAMQCSGAGSNGWQANHATLNNGLNNLWVTNNTWMSWGYHKREDIPWHFALSEGWTIADMYQEGVIASTEPNRVHWMTGTINAPGGPTTPDQGGTVLDNNGTPGCEVGPGLGCFPFSWKTYAEYLQDAGVTWQVYQDVDNFGDDALGSFVQFMDASNTSELYLRGNSYPGLQAFYDDAMSGTLPLVSWIVGPAELSEHNPYMPTDGAWLLENIINAVTKGKSAKDTVLFIMYDETGGWGDHVVPFHSPEGTAAEWMDDPFGLSGYIYTGPGYRVPMHIVSPWTRGQKVFTEHADHASQIMFVETWLEALGYENVQTQEMTPWRRAHMSNFVNAFDFDHPDYSIPVLPAAIVPSTDSDGNYDGSSRCMDAFGSDPKPPAPYGPENANADTSLLVEEGFKSVQGYLTEGRYLVFEQAGHALTNGGPRANTLSFSPATPAHDLKAQRWIVNATGGEPVVGGKGSSGTYLIKSALDGRYIAPNSTLQATGAQWNITFLGNGQGYSLQDEAGRYLGVQGGRPLFSHACTGWQVYSVMYHN